MTFKLVPNFHVFAHPNFNDDGLQISEPISRITLTNTWKSCGDNRLMDLRDYAVEKNKEISAAKHNGLSLVLTIVKRPAQVQYNYNATTIT